MAAPRWAELRLCVSTGPPLWELSSRARQRRLHRAGGSAQGLLGTGELG